MVLQRYKYQWKWRVMVRNVILREEYYQCTINYNKQWIRRVEEWSQLICFVLPEGKLWPRNDINNEQKLLPTSNNVMKEMNENLDVFTMMKTQLVELPIGDSFNEDQKEWYQILMRQYPYLFSKELTNLRHI